jgi:DNA-binding transcriptional MerR regulator
VADDLLSIGAFSRASSISVRTLRNYHESGLLVPASVDPGSGYRSYTVDQLADALVIVRLRALDLPLPAVHRVLSARDPELTRSVLAGHEQTMRVRLEETERIVAALQHGMPAASTPAHLVTTLAVHTLECSSKVPSATLWTWLEQTSVALLAAAGARRSTDAIVSALYTGALTDEEHEELTIFVPIDETFLVPASAVQMRIGQLPATTWAALTHIEGFDTVGDTYRLLGAWVARNAEPTPDGRICELYPGLTGGHPRTDATIEIRWPLVTAR